MIESRLSCGHQNTSSKLSSGISLIARLSKSPSPKLMKGVALHPFTKKQNLTEGKENTDDYSPSIRSRASCEPLSASATPSPLPSITVVKRQRSDYFMGASPPPFQIRRDSDVQMSTPVESSTLSTLSTLEKASASVEDETSAVSMASTKFETPTKSRVSRDSISGTMTISMSSIYDDMHETPRKKRSMEILHSTIPRRKRSSCLRHKPSKLDLIDQRELTFFPLHAQASDCGDGEPLVFVEDYFISDHERSRTLPDTPIKKCSNCFVPLYEFSNFLESIDSDKACKYSEFLCTKCARTAHPHRSHRRSRSVRKAQSSYELRSRLPLLEDTTTSSGPFWWEAISRKLRWRWRTRGLIPRDVLDLVDPPKPHY